MKKIARFLALLAFSTFLYAEQDVVWLHTNYPPYAFSGTQMESKGSCESAMFESMKFLTEFEHKPQDMPFKRFLELAKTNPNYCYYCLIKNPEREGFMYFSKPFMYELSNVLVVDKKKEKLFEPFLESDGKINLDKMFASGKISVAIYDGRSYGKVIDDALSKYKSTKLIKSFSSSSESQIKILQRMFTLNGYEAMIGYPNEISWILKESGDKENSVTFYEVQGSELFSKGDYTYVACSKSEVGKKIIDAVDKNIDTVRKESLAKYRDFLDEKTGKIYKDHETKFLEGNK